MESSREKEIERVRERERERETEREREREREGEKHREREREAQSLNNFSVHLSFPPATHASQHFPPLIALLSLRLSQPPSACFCYQPVVNTNFYSHFFQDDVSCL